MNAFAVDGALDLIGRRKDVGRRFVSVQCGFQDGRFKIGENLFDGGGSRALIRILVGGYLVLGLKRQGFQHAAVVVCNIRDQQNAADEIRNAELFKRDHRGSGFEVKGFEYIICDTYPIITEGSACKERMFCCGCLDVR